MAQNRMKAKPALPERVRSMEELGVGCLVGCDRYRALDGQGLAKRFYSLNFVHRFRGEIRLTATRARPQRHTFNDEEVGTFTEAACHMLELDCAAAAMCTLVLKRSRQ